MTPSEGVPNAYGETRLVRTLGPAADAAAGLHLMTTVNLALGPAKWIQPDVTILRHVSVALLKLDDGAYRGVKDALSGKRFRCDESFPIDFAPEDLLY